MREITQELQQSEDAMRALLPASPHKVWEIVAVDGEGIERQLRYVQSELSFFEKQDFITLLGGYIDRFASGEFGISLKELLEGDVRGKISIPTELSAQDADRIVTENAGLIQTIIRVINTLPDLQIKLIVLALGVPELERDFVSTILKGPIWRGGLTDDQAFDILKTFITHNAGPIRSFFVEKGTDLVEHFQREVLEQETEADQNGDTHGGTPSSTTPPQPASIPSPSETGPPVASS